jgi:hypothetical protein
MLLKFIVFIFSVSNKRDERENHCIPVEESERRWLELILAKKKKRFGVNDFFSTRREFIEVLFGFQHV